MSANDLSKFLYALNHTQVLLTSDQRKEMRDKSLGLYVKGVKNGYCYFHGGYLRSADPEKSQPSERAEINALAASFSDGIELALLVNSSYADSPNAPPDFMEVVKTAYNDAWGISP